MVFYSSDDDDSERSIIGNPPPNPTTRKITIEIDRTPMLKVGILPPPKPPIEAPPYEPRPTKHNRKLSNR